MPTELRNLLSTVFVLHKEGARETLSVGRCVLFARVERKQEISLITAICQPLFKMLPFT